MTAQLRLLASSVVLFAFAGCQTIHHDAAIPRPESVGLQVSYADGHTQTVSLRSGAEFLIRDREHPVLMLTIIHAHGRREPFYPSVIEAARRGAAPDNGLLVVSVRGFTFQSAARLSRFEQHRP